MAVLILANLGQVSARAVLHDPTKPRMPEVLSLQESLTITMDPSYQVLGLEYLSTTAIKRLRIKISRRVLMIHQCTQHIYRITVVHRPEVMV